MKTILVYLAFIGVSLVAGAVLTGILLVRCVTWRIGRGFYFERKAG